MAKSKSNNLMIVVSIFLIILILGSIGLVIYYLNTPQTIIQTGTYTCPDNHYCSVTPILKCETPTITQKVKFRASEIADAPSEIAINHDGDSDLDAWLKGGGTVSGSACTGGTNIGYGFNNIKFAYYNGYVIACNVGNYNYRYTQTGASITTSLTPTEPYKSSGRELYEGNQNIYSCSRDIFVDNIKKSTIYHSSNVPTPTGGLRGNAVQLTQNQVLTVSVSGGGIISLDYTTSQVPITTCTSSNGTKMEIGDTICKDQYTLEKCESVGGQPTKTTQTAIPPKVCRNGEIKNAYNVDITLNKLVLARTENLVVDFNLKDTDFNKNIDITARIDKGSQFQTEKIQKTGNTYLTAGKTTFTFDALSVGYYTLKVSFSHTDGDFSKDINFQVTEDLAIILTTANPIQFDSKDIEASLQSFRSGSPKDLTNFELEVTFPTPSNKVYQYTTEHPSLGILTFKFPINGDGTLRLRARGNDESGLWTDWTDYFEITVKKATILFSTDFQTDKCVGSLTQRFETRDTSGILVDTQNQVTIDKPLGGTDSASVSGSGGKYQFSYNFNEGGIYIIRITSTNPQLGSSQLNAGQGEIVNILTGEACVGGGCEGISCYTNYIIIGGIILAVIAFVYFVFFFRRKR